MNVLVVDVGGTNVKVLATGQDEPRKFPSGPLLTAAQMVAGVKELAGEWPYEVVAIGYPGLVHEGRIAAEPRNLAAGWVSQPFPGSAYVLVQHAPLFSTGRGTLGRNFPGRRVRYPPSEAPILSPLRTAPEAAPCGEDGE